MSFSQDNFCLSPAKHQSSTANSLIGVQHHGSLECISEAKYDHWHCYTTGILSDEKPTASIGVVVVSVRNNIVPSIPVWCMYSETRAVLKACVMFARLARSSKLRSYHITTMPLNIVCVVTLAAQRLFKHHKRGRDGWCCDAANKYLNFCCHTATDAHVKFEGKQYREVRGPSNKSWIFRKGVGYDTCNKNHARAHYNLGVT